MIKTVWQLVRLEFRLEFRQKHTLAGLALFALASVYLCYQAFQRIDDPAPWNALLWLIILFTAFNAIGKGFQQQSRGQRLYLYWTVSPKAFIAARILYNMALMLVLGLLTFGIFFVFLGDGGLTGAMWTQYLLGLVAGNLGFAGLLTLISAIGGQSNNGVGLTAVLGLPVVIPLVLILNTYTLQVLQGTAWGENSINLLFLLLLTMVMFMLSYLLFPYLWRD